MKINKNLAGLLLLQSIIFSQAIGQTVVKEARVNIPVATYDKFTIENLDFNNESIIIHAFQQKVGLPAYSSSKSSISLSKGSRSIPSVRTIVLDNNITISDDKFELYNLNSIDRNPENKEYVVNDNQLNKIGSHSDKAIEEMVKAYPIVFPAKAPATERSLEVSANFKDFYLTLLETSYNYDRLSNEFFPSTQGNKITPEMPSIDGGSLVVWDNPITDNKLSTVTVLTGVRNRDDKTSEYTNQKLITYNADGKIKNQIDLKFDFARRTLFSQGIKPEHTTASNSIYQGYVHILGTVLGIGKKNNDPDHTNYEIVYADQDGKEIFKYKFQFGIDRFGLNPVYAYAKDDALFVFAKQTGKESGYSILKFTKDGLIANSKYTEAEVNLMKVGAKFGLQNIVGKEMKVQGHLTLANGDILIYGQQMENLSKYFRPTPAAPTKPDDKYENYIFLQFTADGKYKKQYIVERAMNEGNSLPTTIDLIDKGDNKIYFMAREPKAKSPQPVAEFEQFQSELAPQKVSAKNQNNVATNPVLISLDLTTEQVSSWRPKPQKDSATFFSSKFYSYNKKENSLLIFGRQDTGNKSPLTFLLTKVQL